jgi:hypothetical protein
LHWTVDMRFAALVLLSALGCSRANSAGRDDPPDGNASRREGVPLEAGRKAPTSPEIVERATRILAEHGDEPVGTEIPFTLNGRRYVGRIEVHDNPDGSPERPSGEHKGVTVYIAP